ncbi:MAG: Gfo/Idh/MocA family oxidoreductase [Defluviitaleaceae bacterium]|nr:Gfo/Idh/MocA family oxidoreductase [Defluviitaleaceae bacterium]
MLKGALIGVGMLGRGHLKNLLRLEKDRGDFVIVAISDVEESRMDLPEDPDKSTINYRKYTDADALLKNEAPDFIISAVPSYLHAEIAIKAVKAGAHVLSEKPIALSIADCEKMAEAAKLNGKILQIGQCLRFWPEYVKLREYISTEAYGRTVRAEFNRLCQFPVHSWKRWMNDFDKSGGAALDLHVHDADFIQYAFGPPASVSSQATHAKMRFESLLTRYEYPGMIINSTADWGFAGKYPFSMSFTVRFENATVEMNAGGFKVYPDGAEPFAPELDKADPYMREADEFIGRVIDRGRFETVPVESVLRTMRLVFAEMESAEKGGPVAVNL